MSGAFAYQNVPSLIRMYAGEFEQSLCRCRRGLSEAVSGNQALGYVGKDGRAVPTGMPFSSPIGREVARIGRPKQEQIDKLK